MRKFLRWLKQFGSVSRPNPASIRMEWDAATRSDSTPERSTDARGSAPAAGAYAYGPQSEAEQPSFSKTSSSSPTPGPNPKCGVPHPWMSDLSGTSCVRKVGHKGHHQSPWGSMWLPVLGPTTPTPSKIVRRKPRGRVSEE